MLPKVMTYLGRWTLLMVTRLRMAKKETQLDSNIVGRKSTHVRSSLDQLPAQVSGLNVTVVTLRISCDLLGILDQTKHSLDALRPITLQIFVRNLDFW